MPREEELPPSKRVSEITTQLTLELHDGFTASESSEIRNNKVITFLIKQIAILKAEIELRDEIS